jgi:hypothetical protein
MLKGNQMQISIKLTEKQVALLLQVLDEQISVGNIEASEQALASEVLEILETCFENFENF